MNETEMDKQLDYKYLPHINLPADLRRLRPEELPAVCEELRRRIIDELADNPGHFASSLGVVELTVALHYVMDTPEDRIVWDVGHQAYGHKILTGRRDRFSTNRKLGGIRPFPSPKESEYDTFACGHASNSISAALGMSHAALRNGHQERRVVAVIGDGKVEIRLGCEAGARTVGLATNEQEGGVDAVKRDRLIKAGADIIAGDFLEKDALLAFLGL
jgi:1-deoxy-D-xylulose-5-phosphate synthase